MRERLRGYADAVLETSAADVATIAGQLQGFSDLLAGSVDLHWALASPATPLPAKRTILQQLLAKKVSTPVIDLLTFTLQNGGVDDFGEDVNALAVAANARRDGKVLLDEGPLGRIGATERLEGYATAVLAPVRGERALGDIEDELFRFVRIVEGHDGLRAALTTGELSSEARATIARELLEAARPAGVSSHGVVREQGRATERFPRPAGRAGSTGGERDQPAHGRRPLGRRADDEATGEPGGRPHEVHRVPGRREGHPGAGFAWRVYCHHRGPGYRHEFAPSARPGQGNIVPPCARGQLRAGARHRGGYWRGRQCG